MCQHIYISGHTAYFYKCALDRLLICGDSLTRKELSEDGTREKLSKELILQLRAAREKYQLFGQM